MSIVEDVVVFVKQSLKDEKCLCFQNFCCLASPIFCFFLLFCCRPHPIGCCGNETLFLIDQKKRNGQKNCRGPEKPVKKPITIWQHQREGVRTLSSLALHQPPPSSWWTLVSRWHMFAEGEGGVQGLFSESEMSENGCGNNGSAQWVCAHIVDPETGRCAERL